MTTDTVDLAIIGGGINGCGIARDAAGRGLSVVLFEQDDFGGATSSWSTKLIHGGLRYLEHYEFRLVREALIERERLWRLAPHVIRPLRFVLPHHVGLRPAWLLRIGLFLYDNLGGRRALPGTRTLDLAQDPAGVPLRPGFTRGFEYSDCRVDDSRLVILNAIDARERGAVLRSRTRVTRAARADGLWSVEAMGSGSLRTTVRARALVNAAGPWAGQLLGGTITSTTPGKVRLVQGSHIVVPKLYDHDRAYIFQHADGRIVFAIPYEDDFTLIGTTDRDTAGDPAAVRPTEDEVAYLCAAINRYMRRAITPGDVVWAYAGVRPLYDDGATAAQEATRDYVLALDHPAGEAPAVHIFGGKITTYRKLGEAVLDRLAAAAPALVPQARRGWTGEAPLPGGDLPLDHHGALHDALAAAAPRVPEATRRRWARLYGTRALRVAGRLPANGEPGPALVADLHACELAHLREEEWALTADDVLWRRTKLGLRASPAEAARLAAAMAPAGSAAA